MLIGTPVVYLPRVLPLANGRIAGTSIDDRAGCAVLIALAERLRAQKGGPTVHMVWSVQEEFNLRGVLPAATALCPDIALQIDLMLATDTRDMAAIGDMRLGGGPGMSLYSFHGRGTLIFPISISWATMGWPASISVTRCAIPILRSRCAM